MDTVLLRDLHKEAEDALRLIAGGNPLEPLHRAFITLGLAASVTSLDRIALTAAIDEAFDHGATAAQIQEVIALVSGLGVHSLMVSAAAVLEAAERRGLSRPEQTFDAERQMIWDARIGHDPFWTSFESEMPGFLRALLVLSPDIFTGFLDYCAIPWRSGAVPAKIKELTAMACDATPNHRFRPGFRVHLKNAIKLGVGRTAILQALDIAAEAPLHRGTN
jgi:alkylhydroperoxidase/carboxymuconolactone decarboxylase family protein YurZ